MNETALMVFLDYPLPGHVEPTLTRELGAPSATVLHTCLFLDTLTQADMLRLPVHLIYSPKGRRRSLEVWLGTGYDYALQHGRTFGERLSAAFSSLFSKGYERVVWLSPNVPDVPYSYLTVGVHDLTRADAVIGPSPSGECYFLGLTAKAFRPDMVRDCACSCDGLVTVLDDESFFVRKLPPWGTVTSVRDILELRQRAGTTVRRYSLTLSYLRNRSHLLDTPSADGSR